MMSLLTPEGASNAIWVAKGVSILSAIMGILGTYFMSLRYTTKFLSTLLFALLTPFMFLVGKGQQVRDFYGSRAQENSDVLNSGWDMALGLNLLVWAFFLQLLAIAISPNS
jgi:hypothetical protein